MFSSINRDVSKPFVLLLGNLPGVAWISGFWNIEV